MELTLEQKLTQKLSAQMIQSMEVLQMGTQELQEYVEGVMLENPVLEHEEEPQSQQAAHLFSKVQWLANSDRQNRWYYHNEQSPDLMDTLAMQDGETLYDHLSGQIDWRHLPSALRRAVECVLTGLNRNGWLDESTAALAERCGVSAETMAEAEKLVRQLEPAGVGARTLAECLELQLSRLGESDLALAVVRNHLEDMAKDHYHKIARETGADRSEVQEICDLIRTLDPRPGAAFSGSGLPSYIIPDLLVTESEGELVVTSADERLPLLKVSSYYQDLMEHSDEEQVKDYLTQKVRQADWVIRCIEQRRSTILNCTYSIVRRQSDFFGGAGGTLRPMTMADVAAEVGVHESTVSRAVKDKYLQCARGLFPLSYFFTRALPSDQMDVSSEQARAAIRTLIEGEDRKKPLSDQKLCDLLAAQGISISRRTVAKYREEMGIASTSGRKKF